jgi:DNA-binding NtrC family response regulator
MASLRRVANGDAEVPKPLEVLIVSERPDHLHPLVRILNSSSARVFASFTIRQAQQIFSSQSVDVVFCDEHLADGSYRELFFSISFGRSAPSFVLLLRIGEWEEYLGAMRLGVLDVLRCPLQPPEVEAALARAVTRKQQLGAAREAGKSARVAADGPSAQDLLFEQLLERAAAALGRTTAAADATHLSPKPDDRRPTVVRKGVA